MVKCKNGTHCVPADPKPTSEEASDKNQRMVIVLRYGTERMVEKDTGHAVVSLKPRTLHRSLYTIGSMGIQPSEVKKREEWRKLGAHSAQQRGISGNQEFGGTLHVRHIVLCR